MTRRDEAADTRTEAWKEQFTAANEPLYNTAASGSENVRPPRARSNSTPQLETASIPWNSSVPLWRFTEALMEEGTQGRLVGGSERESST